MVDPTPPSTPLPDKKVGGNFLTKVTAGLPNWAWGVVILVGLGIGYYVIKTRRPSNTTDTSNVVGQTQANNQAGTNALAGAFPTTTSGTQTVPVIPSNTQPVYNPNGDLTAFQQSLVPTTAQSPTTGNTTSNTSSAMTRSGTSGNDNIPIWTQPSVESTWSTVGSIPPNQQIQIGAPVPGNYYGKQSTFVPVVYNGVTGYVGLWDINPTAVNNLQGKQPGQGDIGMPRIRQTEGIYR